MNIPDPIEIGEDQAERWADKNLSGDVFTCFCGTACHIDNGVFIYPNPYAPPVCPDCAN